MSIPEIEVGSDYDGAFEHMVRNWCKTKTTPFKSKKLFITAGPYRSDAVTLERKEGGILHLDFYSAIRAGFGGISPAEVKEIQEEWL
jgi:hypothetical protein